MAKQKEQKSGGSGFFTGLLLGIAVGAALGILFAPRRGEDTRGQLTAQGMELRNQFNEGGIDAVTQQLRERYSEAFTQGRVAYQRARDEVLTRYNKAKSNGSA